MHPGMAFLVERKLEKTGFFRDFHLNCVGFEGEFQFVLDLEFFRNV